MDKTRTLAFQVSEDLFQRIKDYLERYENIYRQKLTQKEFVIGLIEQALEEAVEDFEAAGTARQEEQAETAGDINRESNDENSTRSEESEPDDPLESAETCYA